MTIMKRKLTLVQSHNISSISRHVCIDILTSLYTYLLFQVTHLFSNINNVHSFLMISIMSFFCHI